jgi:chemotaxis response regulator CheB
LPIGISIDPAKLAGFDVILMDAEMPVMGGLEVGILSLIPSFY